MLVWEEIRRTEELGLDYKIDIHILHRLLVNRKLFRRDESCLLLFSQAVCYEVDRYKVSCTASHNVFILQLLKIAFDEEVGSDNIETFRKLVNKVRNPATIFTTFAFSGHTVHPSTQMQKAKEKNASLRYQNLAYQVLE